MLIHIGSSEGITLLEFETVKEEIPQKIPQQETQGEGEQDPEELPECPDYKPSSYLRGKHQSIIRLPYFINTTWVLYV
jgi:hypothetical protein